MNWKFKNKQGNSPHFVIKGANIWLQRVKLLSYNVDVRSVLEIAKRFLQNGCTILYPHQKCKELRVEEVVYELNFNENSRPLKGLRIREFQVQQHQARRT